MIRTIQKTRIILSQPQPESITDKQSPEKIYHASVCDQKSCPVLNVCGCVSCLNYIYQLNTCSFNYILTAKDNSKDIMERPNATFRPIAILSGRLVSSHCHQCVQCFDHGGIKNYFKQIAGLVGWCLFWQQSKWFYDI